MEKGKGKVKKTVYKRRKEKVNAKRRVASDDEVIFQGRLSVARPQSPHSSPKSAHSCESTTVKTTTSSGSGNESTPERTMASRIREVRPARGKINTGALFSNLFKGAAEQGGTDEEIALNKIAGSHPKGRSSSSPGPGPGPNLFFTWEKDGQGTKQTVSMVVPNETAEVIANQALYKTDRDGTTEQGDEGDDEEEEEEEDEEI